MRLILSLFVSITISSAFAIEPVTTLPKRSHRTFLLEKADLQEEIGSFDELDRDLLVMRARNLSIENLGVQYPALPPEKLLKLKQLVGGKGEQN